MNKTIDFINTITSELTDPKANLKDILLKVKVLAFKLKNDKLKDWVENELNGYVGKKIPEYRRIPSAVYGNLINTSSRHMFTKQDFPLPLDHIDAKLRKHLMSIEINNTAAELESMIESNGRYNIYLPPVVHREINKAFVTGWTIDTAWQIISLINLRGIISSIKSTLLSFLLELTDELGENINLNLMKSKKKVDNVFDKTIGSLSGETINISIGNENVQSINSGKKAKVNVAKGKRIQQTNNDSIQKEIIKFIEHLKSNFDKLSLEKDDQEDISSEISIIEKQLSRTLPKHPIINKSLDVINQILIGVTGNAFTQSILENLQNLMSHIG